MTRRLLIGGALLLLALPAPAGAVLAGENGRIVITSARNLGANNAELFLLQMPGESGPGLLEDPFTRVSQVQHRHATWSPDRTKIAYARGTPPGNFDIFIQDMTDRLSPPVQVTNTPNVLDDRPAWSPDGTTIAWESEVTEGSNQRDILMKTAPFTGAVTNFSQSPAAFEGKPAWTPDSTTLYYEKGSPLVTNGTATIVRRIAGGGETPGVTDLAGQEFQPSISPDGSQICFSRGTGFNNTLDLMVGSSTPPTNARVVSEVLPAPQERGDYNCTWSPDGKFVAYVTGTFTSGKLVMVLANGTSPFPITLAQDEGDVHFDGNPDWAPDGRPECPDTTVSTPINTPVTFSVSCVDTGPEYERTTVRERLQTQPTNGTATQELAGDPIVYTPNPGFVGTDTFLVESIDAFGFGKDPSRVTVSVQPPKRPDDKRPDDKGPDGNDPKPRCGGKVATIVGTARGELIVGTKRNDVIAALGGKDRVRSGAGSDIVCGGAGNDRLVGGPGNDTLIGEGGKDSLIGNGGLDILRGGPGRDPCTGGGGRDKASSCGTAVGIP